MNPKRNNAREEYQKAIEALKKSYNKMQSLEAKLLAKESYQHLKNLNHLLEHPEEQDGADKQVVKKPLFGFLKKNKNQEEGLVSIR